MESIRLDSLPICEQQVRFLLFHLHFLALDAPALEHIIQGILRAWENNLEATNCSHSLKE